MYEKSITPSSTDDRILVIVGPTAVGKTAIAIKIAQMIGAEIISADSMQVYRSLDIGTAKPSEIEREKAIFHLIDIASPQEQVTVSSWKKLAEKAIAEIRERGNLPIICGGTGLYVRALLQDWTLAATPEDPEIRQKLQVRVLAEGSQALHQELTDVDPNSGARLHPNDAVRIMRALEVYYATGRPITFFHQRDKEKQQIPAAMFGLTLPRELLYSRIEARVDQMIVLGLEDEVRSLLNRGCTAEVSAMRSLGYKEMVQFIGGQLTHPECVSAIKQSTCRYAKRQQTWFRADPTIQWIDVSALSSAMVASRILNALVTGSRVSI